MLWGVGIDKGDDEGAPTHHLCTTRRGATNCEHLDQNRKMASADSNVKQSFLAAARKGERVVSLDGQPAVAAPLTCAGCRRTLEPPVAFAPVSSAGKENSAQEGDEVEAERCYCSECRAALLGPPCMSCGGAVARADGIVALDGHWHRKCFRCTHGLCGTLLGERYFVHEGSPYCRAHYLELAGERCAACNGVVDGGLRALGRAWHEDCLRCAQSGEPLGAGTAYLHEGRPVASESRVAVAPRCLACGEPAVSGRVYAHGGVYHSDCFRCVHCRVLIGERKFVLFDGEPYLDACYQQLFGASAGEAMRTQVHGTHHRYALTVPLLLSIGPAGLANFSTKHEELLPAVRRLLRESGILQFSTFLFQPPAVSKPSLVIHMLIPATLDAHSALPSILQTERVGQQWEQLMASVHDVAASRGNSWYSNLASELGPSGSGSTAAVASEAAAVEE